MAPPQCSDAIDNDGDALIDARDPGCHTDGNAENMFTYNASHTSERDPPSLRYGETGPRAPPPARTVIACGNGLLELPEECDDGNRQNADGCTSDCKWEKGRCGDGILQKLLDEQCDPPLVAPDHPFFCGTDCRWVSRFCGDGVVNPGEQCDDGNGNSDRPDARCRSNCSFGRCGDGILDPQTEECDPPSLRYGETGDCDRFCRRELRAVSQIPPVLPVPTVPTVPSSTPPTAACADAVDNDGDTLIDAQDPGCHTDGNAANPSTYNASHTSERDPRAPPPSAFLLPPPRSQLTAPSQPKSGPEILAVMAAGAAGGLAWMRRRNPKHEIRNPKQ